MRRTLLVLASMLCLLTSACTGTAISRFESVNALVEEERTQLVTFVEAKRCKMPMDWVTDQAKRAGRAWLIGYMLQCEDVRSFVERGKDALDIFNALRPGAP
jgi:hypothetical protein